MTRLIRWGLEGLLLAGVIAYAGLVVRDFSHYADHYPYIAVDDGLANVSYALATEGRYGFLTSPIQGFTDLMRDRGFFNYGPWYFYLGAGLIWLFGYSLTLLRAIHPAAILAIAATACWWFGRRRQAAAGALVALGLLHSFTLAQWPMVRPDIAVSVFAIVFIVAAGLAIERESPVCWFVAGLGAGAGALTHLVAYALVPCCLAVLAIALASERPSKKRAAVALVAVVLGLAAATLMFYASFGFRIRDHLAMLRAYSGYLGGTTSASGGYRAVLAEHLRMAFWYLSPPVKVALAASVAANLGLLMAVWRLSRDTRKQILAAALPPAGVLVFYGISLGAYGSHHTGYVILLQVTAWWCAGVTVWALLSMIEGARPSWRVAGAVVALGLIGVNVTLLASRGSNPRLGLIKKWVSISEYMQAVDNLMTDGATAWGTAIHGIESPGRLQLVELVDGVNILERTRLRHPVDSLSVAPQYLVWDYPLNRDNTLKALRGRDPYGYPNNAYRRVLDQLRSVRYRLIGLVSGPPYGVTRVYERLLSSQEVPRRLPAVSVYDAATEEWAPRLEGPMAISFRHASPVLLNINYRQPAVAAADRSVVADLPPGRYLLRVSVASSPGSETRGTVVSVTSAPAVTEAMGELGPSFDVSPYGESDGEAYLLHEHTGGPVYVSQFDNGRGAAIDGVEVYRIRPVLEDDQRAERLILREMPPLASWIPLVSAGVRAAITESGALEVDGDASRTGYQISSPPIASKSFTRATIRAAFTRAQGAVCLGALNGNRSKWLANGGGPAADFSFTVDETAAFSVVFYNCNAGDAGNTPSRFTVSRIRYATEDPGLYVDRLLSVRNPASAAASIVIDPRVRPFPPGLVVSSDEIANVTMPLGTTDMQFNARIARVEGTGWAVKGKADTAFSYLLRSKPQKVDDGRRLIARVRVRDGGVTVGLLRNDQWAAQVHLTSPGEFIVVIEPPGRGEYDVVVANNLSGPPRATDVEVSRIGWVSR